MTTLEKTIVTVETLIDAPVEQVWKYWNEPVHIIHWNSASDDWHTPWAENDLKVGGQLICRMESRDGEQGFEFSGRYLKIEPHHLIEYVMDDGRHVSVSFIPQDGKTNVRETFETETSNSVELQQDGWQAILDNFKKYVEGGRFVPLHFEINIHARAEEVYKIMLNEKHYPEWTSEFNPTSRYQGSWEKGRKILFTGVNEKGQQEGMIGRIKENVKNKFVSIEYIGLIVGGEEITGGTQVDEWRGALENYTFRETDGKTILTVDIDTTPELKNEFLELWPKALKKLKTLCEK